MKDEKTPQKLSNALICRIEQVARLGRLSAHRFFEKNEKINITFNEFLILETLHDHPKIHQRNLAQIMLKDTANLSRDLDKLEKKEMIVRSVEIVKNRTVKTLTLSPYGKQIYFDICEQCIKNVEKIENVFSDKEYNKFIELIEKFQSRLLETMD